MADAEISLRRLSAHIQLVIQRYEEDKLTLLKLSMVLQRYEKVCFTLSCETCNGTGKVRYYSSSDPENQLLEDIAGDYQEEDCPDCTFENQA